MFDFLKKYEFLVAIDSDGCAFDTMELKHKECFVPQFIHHYQLQAVSKYARQTWEFVNLYSKSRGTNRFLSLLETLERLRQRPEVTARGATISIPQSLAKWVREENKLGNPALKQAVETLNDADLERALAWSIAVNADITRMVHGVPPFPFVRRCLEKLALAADMLVCSATPGEALMREWEEHGIDRLVAAIYGQEVGTKTEILAVAKDYPAGHVLMVGDAPGDYKAAVANRALFFAINPGSEEQSWETLFRDGIDRFLGGTFAGKYQAHLLNEFDNRLPTKPSWQ